MRLALGAGQGRGRGRIRVIFIDRWGGGGELGWMELSQSRSCFYIHAWRRGALVTFFVQIQTGV